MAEHTAPVALTVRLRTAVIRKQYRRHGYSSKKLEVTQGAPAGGRSGAMSARSEHTSRWKALESRV